MNLLVVALVTVLLTILGYVVTERATDDTDLAFLVAVVVLVIGVIAAVSGRPWRR